jgi:hypothetical protein
LKLPVKMIPGKEKLIIGRIESCGFRMAYNCLSESAYRATSSNIVERVVFIFEATDVSGRLFHGMILQKANLTLL